MTVLSLGKTLLLIAICKWVAGYIIFGDEFEEFTMRLAGISVERCMESQLLRTTFHLMTTLFLYTLHVLTLIIWDFFRTV